MNSIFGPKGTQAAPLPYGAQMDIRSQLPIIQNFAWEMAHNVQSPLPMIISTLYSAVSIACQNSHVVSRPNGLKSPLSLYFLVIAEAGERKTATDTAVTVILREFQRMLEEKQKARRETYERAHKLWFEQKRAHIGSLQIAKKKGKAISGLLTELEQILSNEPTRPKGYKLLLDNVTGSGLLQLLNGCHPCTGIFSDEGLTASNALATNNIGYLNKAWGGGTLDVQRAASESFTVENPRLTVSLMFQPGVFGKFMHGDSNVWRQSGFLARALVAYPTSTQGYRPAQTYEAVWNSRSAFSDRLMKLLEESHPEHGISDPKVLTFSREAAVVWARFADAVEMDQVSGAFLSDVRDAASKTAENVARMAALNQRLESDSLEISADNVRRAIELCSWYLTEFKRIFSRPPEVPQEIKDAELLHSWLWAVSQLTSAGRWVRKNDIAQKGPSHLRRKVRWQPALNTLVMQGRVWVQRYEKSDYVYLNLACLPTQVFS